MTNLRTIWPLLGLLAMLAGCGKGMRGTDYKAWVEDPAHGLRQEVLVQGHVFELQYEPAPYRVLRSVAPSEPDAATLEAGLAEEAGHDHFRLTVRREDGQPLLSPSHLPGQMAQSRREYLAFKAEGDLHLLVNGAKVPPSFYHYEDDMGLRPGVTLLFSFPAMQKDQGLTLKFHDRQFTGTEVAFTLDAESLKNVPPLKVASQDKTPEPQHGEKI